MRRKIIFKSALGRPRDMLVPRRISFWGVLKIYQIAPGFDRGAWCSRCWSFPSPSMHDPIRCMIRKTLKKTCVKDMCHFWNVCVCVIVAICKSFIIYTVYSVKFIKYVFSVKCKRNETNQRDYLKHVRRARSAADEVFHTHVGPLNAKNSVKNPHPKKGISSWWLNQPIWKILVKMGIFPK